MNSESPVGPAPRHGGRPREECGVCAVVGVSDAAKLAYLGIFALQHRGQEAAGILAANTDDAGRLQFRLHQGLGLVADVFDASALDALTGTAALGHVRYSTTGSPNPANTQPIFSELRHGLVGVAHNGNLTNAHVLKQPLLQDGAMFRTSLDTELLLHLINRPDGGDFETSLRRALEQVEGAYSLVILHGRRVYAVRDPRGFRPLALGRHPDGGWVVASESVAFDLMGAELVRDLAPGEIVRIDDAPDAQPVSLAPLPAAPAARCVFELIYFARADSRLEGRRVQDVRRRLGEELWREHPADADVVICVPDSSIPAAIGYARAAGLPFELGMIRNNYVGRTFIEPTHRIRHFGSRVKYHPLGFVVEGRRIAVVDDSIVRGTTARKIVRMLKSAGARAVHLRLTAPPWRHSCLYGIDTPDPEEFIAHGRTVEEVGCELGVDSIGHLSTDGLRRATEQADGWCMACFTGSYPTPPVKLTKAILEESEGGPIGLHGAPALRAMALPMRGETP